MVVAFVFAACLAVYAVCFWPTFGELERREAQPAFKRATRNQ